MPDQTVPTPDAARFAGLHQRAVDLGVELDALDAQLCWLPEDNPHRRLLAAHLRTMRDVFDVLVQDIETAAAGLQHRPGCPRS